MNETKVPENRAYKVTLIVLVGLAAFSTAMKDLNRLQEMVSSVQEFTHQWRGTDLVTLNEKPTSMLDSCPNDTPQLLSSAVELGSSDAVGPDSDIEIEKIDDETSEPEVGGRVEPVGRKKANRNVPQIVRARYAPARNRQEEISLQRRDGRWPARFEYKTFDRTVTVDLPMTMFTDIKAASPEAEVSRDFLLSLPVKIDRKQSHGKTDNGRPEIMIKRFERSFSSRRVS